MQRYLRKPLLDLLGSKILLLSGPRQVGKTTLCRNLVPSLAYYNFDIKKDLKVFRDQEWDRTTDVVVFDELHKMKKWKQWLKGLYDEDPKRKQQIIVTGSARLEALKKVGDSLAGRHFHLRLHPFDIKELAGQMTGEEAYRRLLQHGGFPEPFLKNSSVFSGLWRKSHTDTIVRQDLLSLEVVKDINQIEVLIELLSERVGSLISHKALAEDLGKDEKTVKRWIGLLEDLYVVFRVTPYSKNISRSLRKMSKCYFYDLARVQGDEAIRLENLVALALLKEIHFQEDVNGVKGRLHFIRTKEQYEIDFAVQQQGRALKLIEVKLSDSDVSRNFALIKAKMKEKVESLQLVKNLERSYSNRDGVTVIPAIRYLEKISLA